MNPFPFFFRISLLLWICISLSTDGFAQCQSKLELLSVKKVSKSQSNGRIQIKVNSTGPYSVTLYEVSGSGLQQLSIAQGSGEEKFKFENLSGEQAYRIEVNFTNETEFLCRKKVLSDIFLTKER